MERLGNLNDISDHVGRVVDELSAFQIESGEYGDVDLCDAMIQRAEWYAKEAQILVDAAIAWLEARR